MRARRWWLVGVMGVGACGPGSGVGPTEPLLDQLPRPLSGAEVQVVDAGNAFTFGLFRRATAGISSDSNVILSPFSASMALGMALNGAQGETFDAMRQTLGFGSATLPEMDQGYHDLTTLLLGLDQATQMDIANSIWIRQGFPVKSSFTDMGRTHFDAEVQSLDFASAAALPTINGWVKAKTNGRIPSLLDRIDDNEVLFLVNAVYFKGRWRLQFDPAKTQDEPFHGADGQDRSVPMMHLTGAPIRMDATPSYQAADLLYGNGAFTMTIVLPAEGTTPAQVLATLGPAEWRALTEGFAEHEVPLSLPKFTLDYERSLKPDLDALGMGVAFDPNRADFGEIADDQLYITRVEQKVFVQINEEGTEAAAATSVGTGLTSVPVPMVVNRPFLLVIRERFSGTILFIGQVNRLGL
jgi:serine protease inhibitor